MAQMEDGGGMEANADHPMLRPDHDISHILAAESPFMRPEFVLDSRDIPVGLNTNFSQARDSLEKARLEMQQHFMRRSNNCRQAGGGGGVPRPAASCSRPGSPFLKPPRVIKNEGDDSLYVKVEDLPEEVREQVRLMTEAGGDNSFDGNNNTSDNQQRKLPFNEPTRLSAQPTVEEIQMCFAQVDLAILMETKPARRTSPTRSGGAASAGGRSANHHHKLSAMAARRREKWAAARSRETPQPPPPPMPTMHDPAFDSNSESDTSAQTPPIFESNNNPMFSSSPMININANPSRMQQLLVELANSRRNSAISNNNEANYDAAAKRSLGKVNEAAPSPPFAVGNNLRRSSHQIYQNDLSNFSFLRNDFVRKLEQIQALAAARPPAAVEDTHIEDIVRGNASAESKRAYQRPVWTHGSSSTNGRVRYQSSWSGHSQEEYEIIDPLVAAGHHRLSGGGDAETSTDADSQQAAEQ